MKAQLFIFYICLIFIFSFNEESIIKIPNKIGKIENIPTRKGFINYEFHIFSGEEFMASVICVKYIIEGIIKEKEKEPETIEFTTQGSEIDSRNKDICQMFYEYDYIDNLIYSIDSKYKYFGGLPIYKDSSFEKFTFNSKIENVTEISLELNNGTKFVKNINYNFEITEQEIGLVYLPEEIFSFFYDIFLKDYEKDQYGLVTMYDNSEEIILNADEIYKVNNEQKKLFPNIWFKIGNKKFLINGFNALNFQTLFIIKGYRSFTFGQEFLKIFDIREFNITSGEINLYVNKKKPCIKVIEEKNNLKKKGTKEQGLPFLSIVIIIFISIITITTLYFHRKYNKKINIDYYNYYYNV